MADISFRGDDDTTAQVNTVTPGGTIGTETFTVTINGKTISVTATGGDAVADVVDDLVAAFNTSTEPEFAEITATDSTTCMTLTADAPGVPFTQTSAATGSATCVTATTRANVSPNQLSAGNCSGGAIPGAGDSFFVDNCSVAMLYGLDQSGAGTLTKLSIGKGMTGYIGLPVMNAGGSTSYYEYRPRYYKLCASACDIGAGAGNGSGRMLLDFSTVQSAIVVFGTGTSVDSAYHALRLKGTHASNSLQVLGGSVDIAPEGGEVATLAVLSVAGSAQVRTSAGTTLATVTASGSSKLEIQSASGLAAITAITVNGSAQVIVTGDNPVTTISVIGGTCVYNGTGTITTLIVGSKGIADFSQGSSAVTVTNCTKSLGGQISDPYKRVTFTNGIDLSYCGVEDGGLSLGKHLTITPSAI